VAHSSLAPKRWRKAPNRISTFYGDTYLCISTSHKLALGSTEFQSNVAPKAAPRSELPSIGSDIQREVPRKGRGVAATASCL